MKLEQCLVVLALTMSVRVAALNPVLVQCSNSTVHNDPGFCWRQRTSVVCNNLDGGVREASRLDMSLLVENVSSCAAKSRLRNEACKKDCLCTSNDHTTLAVDRNKTDQSSDHLLEQKILHRQYTNIYPSSESRRSSCPPGFIPTENENGQSSLIGGTSCTCLEGVEGIVKCATVEDSTAAFIRSDYCMTYDKDSGNIHIAASIISCPDTKYLLGGHTDFYALP